MPEYRQGDIFSTFRDEGFQLAIVFGHLGFNFMAHYWYDFAAAYPDIFPDRRLNPFDYFPDQPIAYRPCKFMWFVPERKNHGMKDSELKSEIFRIFQFYTSYGIQLLFIS